MPQLWLIELLTCTIERYGLVEGEYRLEATAGAGESLVVPGFDGLTIDADRVFDTQSKRFKDKPATGNGRPKRWAIPRGRTVGLQHLILLGHAERRREIWNNQSPCFLAFGSSEEASHRLDHFVLEASQWEGMKAPAPVEIEPHMETANVRRFHFVRHGHIVRLNVDVSGLLYRELLTVTADRKAWDWGEETRESDH